MAETIEIKIVTPEKTVFQGVGESISLPTPDGQITILPNHISYIASIIPGEIKIRHAGEETLMSVSGGFIEFNKNGLVILADTAERAEEIDIEKAEAARNRAEELKKKAILADDTEYAQVVSILEKEISRVRVARKHHSRHGISLQ